MAWWTADPSLINLPLVFLVEEEAYAQVRNNPLSSLPITSGQIQSGHFDS